MTALHSLWQQQEGQGHEILLLCNAAQWQQLPAGPKVTRREMQGTPRLHQEPTWSPGRGYLLPTKAQCGNTLTMYKVALGTEHQQFNFKENLSPLLFLSQALGQIKNENRGVDLNFPSGFGSMFQEDTLRINIWLFMLENQSHYHLALCWLLSGQVLTLPQ